MSKKITQYPDKDGRFGAYGGKFVSETLMPALDELESNYKKIKNKKDLEGSYDLKKNYALEIENSVSTGTIQWRGYLDTHEFQNQLGECRALINTPKWNEAYGNVVMESMA